MSRDEYYADRASRFDTLAGPENAAYWRLLARLGDVYSPDQATDSVFGMPKRWDQFSDWCEQHHGFRPVYDSGGGITGRPNVVDEQKYTMCVLKYGG